mmetsp:Transcript_18670/g.60359  ORF Transcript_18670/g.60359 Transcript_18670/m.60359 type:complete len:381 (+) Transcript_18670:130-1272(+)|eukprot:CAMPEP_0118898168 /NCGR_PEP_ID=MMETSP1166-20130328/5263_1 /TAXON_ID=1104430 /ORGANISM="Chrysoreinhardia sp, Strain CCMP3193" /LENGTH=380 /DNA_ID=CAMNT_0006837263 /DNA_START=100 /DNA_END=1242 /DNA_ORIENTATION=+
MASGDLSAPVFGSASDDPANQINLDEIFDEVFAQDWKFMGDVTSAEGLIDPLLESLLPPVSEAAPAKRQALRKTYVEEDDADDDSSDAESEYVVVKKKKKKRKSGSSLGGGGGGATTALGGQTKRRRRAGGASPAGTGARGGSPIANADVDLKDMTDQQRVERRERNREHAKRSRIRKKFLLESLLEQVSDLRGENKALRQIIRDQIPDEAHQVLHDCSTEESLLLCAEPSNSPIGPTQQLMEPDFRLMMALQSAQQNFAVSDPSLPDNPIVYASKGFLTLTGYSMHQVIGRNCRFLQGPGTDKRAVDVIKAGVENGVDTSVCLLNYKADGTPFWNQFFVAALRDADGQIVNYVGVQCEVNQVPIEEIKERAKRMALIDL